MLDPLELEIQICQPLDMGARNLSWVLENLGLMDSSAALEHKSVSEPKGQKGSTRGYRGLFLSSACFSQTG